MSPASEAPVAPVAPAAATPVVEGGAVALRASLVGLVAAGVLGGLVWAFATEELVPATAWRFVLAGALCGVATGALGNYLIARGSLSRPVDPRSSAAFLRGVVLDLVLQFGAVLGGVLLLFSAGVKFEHLAAFGVALAVSAALFRGPGTVMVSRALEARYRAGLERDANGQIAQDPHS